MFKFILRRIFTMLLTMIFVSIVVFLIAQVLPGDIARNALGQFATEEQVNSFRKQMGLEQPLYIRYISWLLGNDWLATRYTDLSIMRLDDHETGYNDWWAIDKDGGLVRWRIEGKDIIKQTQYDEGKVTEELDNEKWEFDDELNKNVFWGIDKNNSLIRWTKDIEGEVVNADSILPLQKGFIRGDPGVSLRTGRPIMGRILNRFKNSLILAGLAFFIVMPIGLVLGILAGINEGSIIDRALSVFGITAVSSPQFATAIFMILIFSFWLGVLPGSFAGRPDALFENLYRLILPIFTLGVIEFGYVLRITRASVRDVMNTKYIKAAEMKGLPRRRIIFSHMLRNALIAPITVIMFHVNWLVGGLIVIEEIFAFPGIGKLMYDASLYKDATTMMTVAMFMVVIAVTTQLVADIIYTFLNPRIRYS